MAGTTELFSSVKTVFILMQNIFNLLFLPSNMATIQNSHRVVYELAGTSGPSCSQECGVSELKSAYTCKMIVGR